MRTRDRQGDGATGLPPPPAPTSPDANPWTISSPASASPDAQPGAGPRVPASSPGPGRRQDGRTAGARDRPPRRVPVLVLLVMAGVGVSLAVDALETQDPAAAFGALLFTAFAVFLAWRSAVRRRR